MALALRMSSSCTKPRSPSRSADTSMQTKPTRPRSKRERGDAQNQAAQGQPFVRSTSQP